MVTIAHAGRADFGAVNSTYAWVRLFVALVLGTIGSVGMWSYVVALPRGAGRLRRPARRRVAALHDGA